MTKGLKATKKELLIPLSENQKKNSEVLTPPTTTSPKLFGKIYPFEQKSEKKMKQQQHYHHLLLSQQLLIHHALNFLHLNQNQ